MHGTAAGSAADIELVVTSSSGQAQAQMQTHTVGFESIRRATNNFDDAHRIGKGASCVVYKALLREAFDALAGGDGKPFQKLWVEDLVWTIIGVPRGRAASVASRSLSTS